MPRDEWRREADRTKYDNESFARQQERAAKPDSAAKWLARKEAAIANSRRRRKRKRRRARRAAEAQAKAGQEGAP